MQASLQNLHLESHAGISTSFPNLTKTPEGSIVASYSNKLNTILHNILLLEMFLLATSDFNPSPSQPPVMSSLLLILVWNARGVGNKRSSTHLKDILVCHNINMLIIIEPKIVNSRLLEFACNMGLTNFAHGDVINNRIWLLLSDIVLLSDITWGSHQVSVVSSIPHLNFNAKFTFVHGPCDIDDRKVLWDDIISQNEDIVLPWIVAGDFNAISYWEKRVVETKIISNRFWISIISKFVLDSRMLDTRE